MTIVFYVLEYISAPGWYYNNNSANSTNNVLYANRYASPDDALKDTVPFELRVCQVKLTVSPVDQ